jgi:hypothetical protein
VWEPHGIVTPSAQHKFLKAWQLTLLSLLSSITIVNGSLLSWSSLIILTGDPYWCYNYPECQSHTRLIFPNTVNVSQFSAPRGRSPAHKCTDATNNQFFRSLSPWNVVQATLFPNNLFMRLSKGDLQVLCKYLDLCEDKPRVLFIAAGFQTQL